MSAVTETPELIEQLTRAQAEGKRQLLPGTGDWTETDLREPEHQAIWDNQRFELVEGVVRMMAPAWFDNTSALDHLQLAITPRLLELHGGGRIGSEPSVVLSGDRVVKPDKMFLTPEQIEQQRQAGEAHGMPHTFSRIWVRPLLVIECVSLGHERYDKVIKRNWYAEFGIPHYWILEPILKQLSCLKLDAAASYQVDTEGSNEEAIKPTLLQGSKIQLGDLWM